MKTCNFIADAALRLSIVSALILPIIVTAAGGQDLNRTVSDLAADLEIKKISSQPDRPAGEAPMAPPANDNFLNASALTVGGSMPSTNIEATGEFGEPNHAGSASQLNSVWYRFTAPAVGVYTVSTASGASAALDDTVIAAYSLSASGLVPIVGSDDYTDSLHGRITFTVHELDTYYIAVDGFGALQGNFVLSYEFLNAPKNDNFADAEYIGIGSFSNLHGISGSNALSTGEAGEPPHEVGIPTERSSIWYKWMSTAGRSVTFRLDGSNYDTVLAVYTGSSVNNLTLVAKNDNFGPVGTDTSRVTFYAPPGIYYIAIDGLGRSYGNSILKWEQYREENGKRWDFDNDHKADVSIFRPSNGQWWIKNSFDSVVKAAAFGTNGDKITPADFTGDGKVDMAVWRPSNGNWYVIRSEDNTFYGAPFGQAGDIPAVGHFDLDARADHVIFRPSTGMFYILKSRNGLVDSIPWGTNGDIPTVADYDGDGRSDLAIFRPSNGEWWLNRSKSGAIGMSFGSAGDKPVVGDYTGDCRADVAFFRPSTGEWFILRSEDSSYYAGPFGLSTDIPVPGDYTGDRKFDLAVFRPSEGKWYIASSSNGAVKIETFGTMGDRPTPSAYIP
jgi:hypothetical protein